MEFDELLRIFLRVMSSWQVIAVTVAIVLYISLITYVARLRRRAQVGPVGFKSKKKKPVKQAPAASPDDELGLEDTTNEELGLE